MPKAATKKTASAPRLFVGLALLLAGIGFIAFGIRGITENRAFIKTPKQLLRAEVVDTDEAREKGLSGRDGLDKNRAMLFVFDAVEKHGFWMKDMKFAIDIVWLDENKKIVSVKENAEPASYPDTFYPSEPAKYVIEVMAGRAHELEMKTSTTLSW